MRHRVLALSLLVALPAFCDIRFQVRKMTRTDVPSGKGQCDIRLQVDGEVEVAVRRDTVNVRRLSGQETRDDGSECNFPLPDRDIRNFEFSVTDSRNDIRLMEPPTPRNNFSTIVRIRDNDRGYGRYVFRIKWDLTPETDSRRRDDQHGDFGRGDFGGNRPPEFVWRDEIHFKGRGSGESRVNDFRGDRLSGCEVEIDRGGRVTATFRTDRGRPLVFSGRIMGRDGARLKGDVASEDGRLRGPMYFSVDDRQMVNSVTLDATDGRDRLHLVWDRR